MGGFDGTAAADSALREALAIGAAQGVWLCDRRFAGSDTWATANALAALIDDLGGADLVLCGISAIDGETGQVGPEVAERLGWPQVIGCEHLDLDGSTLTARRIVEGGYEVLRTALPVALPDTPCRYVGDDLDYPGLARSLVAAV